MLGSFLSTSLEVIPASLSLAEASCLIMEGNYVQEAIGDAWPQVALMVLNWNGKRDLLNCIDSLKTIDYPKDRLQLIVIDNGSSDGSSEAAAEKLVELERLGYARTKLVRFEKNLGAPKAYNIAFEQVKDDCDFIFKIDNDVEFIDQGILRGLVGYMINNPNIGICGPKIVSLLDHDRCIHAAGYINWFWGIPYQGEPDKECDDCDFITGCAMLIRKSVLIQLNSFLDEAYFVYWDDTDLCMRAIKKGYKCAYVPSHRVAHKVGQATGLQQRSLRALYFVERNRVIFVRKHAPRRLRVFIPFLVLFCWLPRRIAGCFKRNPTGVWELRTTCKAFLDGLFRG